MVVVSIYPFTKLCQSLVGGFNAVQKNKSQHGNLPQVGVKIWNHNQELEHLRKFRVTGNKHLFQLTLMFCQQHVNPATSILGIQIPDLNKCCLFLPTTFPEKDETSKCLKNRDSQWTHHPFGIYLSQKIKGTPQKLKFIPKCLRLFIQFSSSGLSSSMVSNFFQKKTPKLNQDFP